MILKKIRKVINEFRIRDENQKIENQKIKAQIAESEWAHIYHDTIKDKIWLKNLSVSPGRWAVNYSFLYVLVRILSDYQPKKIIEFGLGESSKIISSFLENELHNSTHLILEQDESWINAYKSRFKLSKNSIIMNLPIEEKMIKGFPVKSYKYLDEKVNGTFDLYIIDGPFGSENFSRYDICTLAQRININDEFIIIIDDYNRKGERETATELITQFTKKGIKLFTGIYTGSKSQIIFGTEKYKFTISM